VAGCCIETTSDPAAAHTRQLKRLGLRGDELSRLVRRSPGGRLLDLNFGRGEGGRDSVKVAQYEVLGNEAKDTSVPAGTIDQCRQSLMPLRDQEAERSIVPTGTDSSLKR
jgi:hypothetical protein